MIITCQTCSREVEYNNGKSGHSLTKCGSCYVMGRRKVNKERAIEYLGTSIERPSGVVG